MAQRMRVHIHAAETLVAFHADDPAPAYGEIAHHYESAYICGNAEMRAQAYNYLCRAGALAVENNEGVAADLFTRALTIADESDTSEQIDALLAREGVYEANGMREQQRADLESLDQLVAALSDIELQAEVAIRKSVYAVRISDYTSGIAAAQSALALADKANDTEKQAWARRWWGEALWRQGNIAEGRRQFEIVLGLPLANEGRRVYAECERTLGIVLLLSGDLRDAQIAFESALQTYRDIGDRRGEVANLNNLGYYELQRGRFFAAVDRLSETLQLARKIGDRYTETAALVNLTGIFRIVGDRSRSLEYGEQALAEASAIEYQAVVSEASAHLAGIRLLDGEDEVALSLGHQAVEWAKEIGVL